MLCKPELQGVKDCPNCGGTGQGITIPKAFGQGTIQVKCHICLGSKTVPTWDYDRLCLVVKGNTSIQITMEI